MRSVAAVRSAACAEDPGREPWLQKDLGPIMASSPGANTNSPMMKVLYLGICPSIQSVWALPGSTAKRKSQPAPNHCLYCILGSLNMAKSPPPPPKKRSWGERKRAKTPREEPKKLEGRLDGFWASDGGRRPSSFAGAWNSWSAWMTSACSPCGGCSREKIAFSQSGTFLETSGHPGNNS